MFRRHLLALVASILIVLSIAPVHAAPSLGLGSTASYALNANIRVVQDCTADPLAYASQACTGIVPTPPPPLRQNFFSDDFNYSNISQMVAAGWILCGGGAPPSQYSVGNGTLRLYNNGTAGAGVCRTDIAQGVSNWSISSQMAWVGNNVGSLGLSFKTSTHDYLWQADGLGHRFDLQRDGQTIMWSSYYYPQLGTWHVMRAEMFQNMLSLYYDDMLELTSYENGTNLTLFGVYAQWNTNNAYDSIQAATLTPVPAQPPPPPAPTVIGVGLTGTLGWNVAGLSSSQANLVVSHNVALSISPIPIVSYTPVTESGTYEQSINLSTRVESPGTSSALVLSVLSSLLPAMSGILSQTGASSPAFLTMLSGQSSGPEYTQWWVNGPLAMGSPVQILQGWSSVTGNESLSLAGIGTRQAWIVTSQLTQTVNLNIPNVNSPLSQGSTSRASANLKLLWSFDKTADLLLRNNDSLNLTTRTTAPTTIYTNGSCNQFTCNNPITVSVTRDMSVTAAITVQLSSTSLSLSGSTSNTQQNPTLNSFLGMPWMPIGLALLTAGVISGLMLWLGRRTRPASKLHPVPIENPR